MELRPVTAAELPAFLRATRAAFHGDIEGAELERKRALFSPDRTLAVFDGPDIVATTAVFGRELTIPGGAVPVAAVTAVGVLPTHRRRGLLTQLMRRQLDDVRAAAEPVAALWASEPGIYGRFGYGLAARHAELRLPTAGARLRPDAPAPAGRIALLEPGAAVAAIAPLYDELRRGRVGHLDRPAPWWSERVCDPERERRGAGALRAAIHERPDGTVDGYVLYAVRVRWSEGPEAEVVVRELVGDSPGATAALWAYVLGLDLTRSIAWDIAPPDLPLLELVRGPAPPRVALAPNLWVRIVDVGAALAARAYGAPIDVVLEVDDGFCPWNAARWHLRSAGGGPATCERTDASADIALSAADLGAAYLGGTSLAALAAVGRVLELRPRSLERAALAFRGVREPWCPEIF
jgi:predicted acetyltransferase